MQSPKIMWLLKVTSWWKKLCYTAVISKIANGSVSLNYVSFCASGWVVSFFGEIMAERKCWINNEMSKSFFFVLVEVEGPGSVTEKQQVLN